MAAITSQHDTLAAQESALAQRVVSLKDVVIAEQERLESTMQLVATASANSDKSNLRLSAAAAAVVALPRPKIKGASPAHFIAQHTTELEQLAAQERAYTQGLAQYSRKQFHGGVVQAALAEDADTYAWLDVLDGDTLHGRTEAQWAQQQGELRRLQSASVLGQEQLVGARVERDKTQAAVASVRQAIQAVQQQSLGPRDLLTLQCAIMSSLSM